jgi:hypothetical protein
MRYDATTKTTIPTTVTTTQPTTTPPMRLMLMETPLMKNETTMTTPKTTEMLLHVCAPNSVAPPRQNG